MHHFSEVIYSRFDTCGLEFSTKENKKHEDRRQKPFNIKYSRKSKDYIIRERQNLVL